MKDIQEKGFHYEIKPGRQKKQYCERNMSITFTFPC